MCKSLKGRANMHKAQKGENFCQLYFLVKPIFLIIAVKVRSLNRLTWFQLECVTLCLNKLQTFDRWAMTFRKKYSNTNYYIIYFCYIYDITEHEQYKKNNKFICK